MHYSEHGAITSVRATCSEQYVFVFPFTFHFDIYGHCGLQSRSLFSTTIKQVKPYHCHLAPNFIHFIIFCSIQEQSSLFIKHVHVTNSQSFTSSCILRHFLGRLHPKLYLNASSTSSRSEIYHKKVIKTF